MGSRFDRHSPELRAQRWHKQCRPQKFVLLLLAFFLLSRHVTPAEVNDVRRVLVFNDFDPIASPGVALLDQAIFTSVGQLRYQIEWSQESLGANLFTDEASQRHIREWYVRKYQDRKPNLIIAVGPASLQFMIESHERFFPGIPIIFCGSSEEMLERLKPDSHFTGVWGTVQPKETFRAALHLRPTTKHVVVVGGVGAYDRYLERIVRGSLQNYESKFEFTYLTDRDMPTLLGRLSRLPRDTIVLYTSIFQDAAGAHFIDANQSAPMVVGATNVPVFVLFDVNFGTGAVGGDVISFASDGKIAGQMAVSILNGEKLGDIPVVKSANVMMFDWRALRRWGLKESDLPPGSVVFYRQHTVWESYKWYITSGISLILLEALLIGGLVWQRARRRKAETAARESEDRLRLLLGSTAEAIYGIDLEHRCTFCNPACLRDLGYERVDEVIGKNMHNLIHHTRADGTSFPVEECGVHRVTRTGEGVHAEDEIFWRANGTSFPAEYWSYPQRRKEEVVGAVVAFVDITERKLAEAALANVSRRLIEAHEQERTRIGRDLHDDVVQRLVLLAIELEDVQKDVPDSAGELGRRIGDLRNQTTQITDDVQLLSHELHSSKLECLGIVGATKNFCKELSEHQKVEIDFQSHDLLTALPTELSLSLFRVLQEALRNATKHSGVQRFEVRLWGSTGEVHLTVSDLGAGFDAEAAMKSTGLGLTSMQERLRLVGGELSINSQPKRGTTIHARVPFDSSSDSARAAAG